MAERLLLQSGELSLHIDCLETPTAREIIKHLPMTAMAQTWGDEIYFSTPVNVPKETNAKDVVSPGEIAFWVEGSCIAIGFGPTPISEGNEIRLAAKTNIWGTTRDDVRQLAALQEGDKITLSLEK